MVKQNCITSLAYHQESLKRLTAIISLEAVVVHAVVGDAVDVVQLRMRREPLFIFLLVRVTSKRERCFQYDLPRSLRAVYIVVIEAKVRMSMLLRRCAMRRIRGRGKNLIS